MSSRRSLSDSLCLQKAKELEALSHLDEQVLKDKKETETFYAANKAKVIEMLMREIKNISLDVPKVVKENFDGLQ